MYMHQSVEMGTIIFCMFLHVIFALHFFTVLNAVCHLFSGAIVGVVIRYGLDAKKQLYILDCWHNQSKSNATQLPSSVVIIYNNTDYYEYTDGRRVANNYIAQPQFEDKVPLLLCDYYYNTAAATTRCYYYC